MTQRHLERLVSKWQGILRLRDYDIEPVAVRASYVDLQEGNVALYERQVGYRVARISLAMLRSDEQIEEALVHELLHIKLAPLEALYDNARKLVGSAAQELLTSCWADAEEPLINELTQALLRVHGYGCR